MADRNPPLEEVPRHHADIGKQGRKPLTRTDYPAGTAPSASNPFAVAFLSIILGAGSIFGGLMLTTEIDIRFGEQMVDWFRESLGAIVIFPILLVVGVIANRVVGKAEWRLGAKPVALGGSAFLVAIILIGLTLQIGLSIGSVQPVLPYRLPTDLIAFLSVSAVYFIQALSEEVFFRGWLQGSLEKRIRPASAILVTALIFAGLHYVVEPRHPMSAANLLLAGIVLGLIYQWSQGLVAPILFHFGWNWSEAMLFGLTPNPGKIMAGAISDFDLVGPVLLGGGDEGLNTNSISAALLVLIGILLLWLINRKPASRKPVADIKPKPAAAESLKPVSDTQTKPSTSEPPATIFAPGPASSIPASPEPVPAAPVAPTPLAAVKAPPPPLAVVPSGAIGLAATLAATHPGAVREVNEDRYYVNEEGSLWAVADGMGGHKFGDRASTMIVESLSTVSPAGSLADRVSLASEAILGANRAIYLEAQENGSRMGSTVVALVVSDGRYALIWAGDSRAYRLRGNALEQLTRDHTQVQELVDKGELTPEQAARHPMSHVLVRAVGVIETIELETITGEIAEGDVFFLCSDGIYDALDDDEIAEQLQKRGASTNLDTLINLAVAQGARDNVTAIAIVADNLPSEQAQTEGILNP